MIGSMLSASLAMTAPIVEQLRRPSEVWDKASTEKAGIVWRGNATLSPLPHETLSTSDLPDAFSWCDQGLCTMSRNQHIPQYCVYSSVDSNPLPPPAVGMTSVASLSQQGSCWAHGAISALGDRIKIARKGKGIDINLSVQHMLNCGDAGSCHGGSIDGPYQWIHKISKATGSGISYETQQPYMACSSESNDGLCPHADWSCTPENVARTCSTFPPQGKCVGLSKYPNATVSEYGSVSGAEAMAKEIYSRGPISCGIDAAPIENYKGGVSTLKGSMIDHVVSVVGWGNDPTDGQYWMVRNSWGEYWGEMGYIKVAKGNNALLLEEQCAWAVPGTFTEANYPCYEDGSVRDPESNSRPLPWWSLDPSHR